MSRDMYSFQDVETLLYRLEALLQAHDIRIPAASVLNAIGLDVLEVANPKYRREDTIHDPRTRLRHLIGVEEFARAVLAIQTHAEFPKFIPHLRLLQNAAALQNVPTSVSDQSTNKLFELFVAAGVLWCGSNIELDDPAAARGDNPDILITIADARWGVACKTLHSAHRQTIFDNIQNGVQQIDASDCDTGVVVLNLKNIIDHDRYWPALTRIDSAEGGETFAAFSDANAPVSLLRQQMVSIGHGVVEYVGTETFRRLFEDSKSLPTFLLWGHTAAGVVTEARTWPMSVRALLSVPLAPLHQEIDAALQCLNRGLFGHHGECL
jgi:hypothetical protein